MRPGLHPHQRHPFPAIVVKVRPLEETRTANSGCLWLAECEIGGQRFQARSRHGAANDLARQLVAAAVADQPLVVHFDGLRGYLRWGSLTAAAKRTYTEGNRPLQCIRWIASQDAVQAIRAAPKQGVKATGATSDLPEPPVRSEKAA
jgi:hypothetical protein